MNILFALIIKHFIVDIGIQSAIPGSPKHKYFSGHLHYFTHGIGAFFVTIFIVPFHYAIAIGILDYITHWHIDWAKHHLNRRLKAEVRSNVWWWTMVLDQCIHTFCYYGIAVYFSALLAV